MLLSSPFSPLLHFVNREFTPLHCCNADAGVDASILFRIIYFPAGPWDGPVSSRERNVLPRHLERALYDR